MLLWERVNVNGAFAWLGLQIASMTLMKDSERLDLLKEIGGTRVYEERRRESLKIMQETGKLTLLRDLVFLIYDGNV